MFKQSDNSSIDYACTRVDDSSRKQKAKPLIDWTKEAHSAWCEGKQALRNARIVQQSSRQKSATDSMSTG